MGAGVRIRVYKAADGWRWQKWVSSDMTAHSGEAYDDKSGAVEAAHREASSLADPVRVLVEDDGGDKAA